MQVSATPFLGLLNLALKGGIGMYGHILDFLESINASGAIIENKQIDEILRELAFDLDLYEPDPLHRSQDRSFFGDRIAKKRIRLALKRIGEVLASGM
jgi:hypothetical protein